MTGKCRRKEEEENKKNFGESSERARGGQYKENREAVRGATEG